MTRQHPVPADRRAYRVIAPTYATRPDLAAVDALPFVGLVKRGTWNGPGHRCHWLAEPSGDYEADCQRGADFAGLTFQHMGRFPESSLIHTTLHDLVRVAGGQLDGVMVGYLEWVAGTVNAARGRFLFDAYWRQRERSVALAGRAA